jgi:hypothetical protein
MRSDRPKLKGLARAERDAFVSRHGAQYISQGVEETLFRHAEVLTEGRERTSKKGERCYFGSTMITFDLAALQKRWRGPFEVTHREELLKLVQGSVRMHARAHRLACAEVARRVTDAPLGTAIVEVSVRLSGNTLQMDVDLEVPIGVCSGARRAP